MCMERRICMDYGGLKRMMDICCESESLTIEVNRLEFIAILEELMKHRRSMAARIHRGQVRRQSKARSSIS